MNKKYMDFVPAKRGVVGNGQREIKRSTTEVVAKKQASLPIKNNVKGGVVTTSHMRSKTTTKTPALGVVEEINSVGTGTRREVSSKSHFILEKSEIKKAKAKKVGVKAKEETVSRLGMKKSEEIFRTPKPQFINQDKVVKRPLSKNVYQRKVTVPKEEPKGPVTIITKPEKQAHVGMIATIIITIILGAVAGTVAFLLLPK